MSHSSTELRAGAAAEQEPPAARLGRLFKALYQSTRQAMDVGFRREGIDVSFAHFMTLYILSVEPGVAGAELARRGFVTAQTMNTILRRLEQDGAIRRSPHPSNQRADSWHLTSTGQTRMERARVVAGDVWTRMFESFEEAEVNQLERLLERCLAGLDQPSGERRAATSAKAATRSRARARRRT